MTKRNRMMITGGAGLIGSHIVDLLADGEYFPCDDIVVLDNFARGRRGNLAHAMAKRNIRIVEGDILDAAKVRELMEGVDTVFHLAALRITQCAQEPGLAVDVLVNGTFNVLKAAVDAKVRKVVAASSASVYGLAQNFPTPETDHPYGNRTIYGASKLFNEGILRSFNDMYGLDYVALRFFNVYGPRMDAFGKYTEVLIRWMERIVQGQSPIIFGDGLQTMDFVYVTDVARANILAAKAETTDDVFNIGTGVETSLKNLAEMLMHVMGAQRSIDYQAERAVNPVPRRLADVSKARERLGFEAKVGLEEGLAYLVNWWKNEQGIS